MKYSVWAWCENFELEDAPFATIMEAFRYYSNLIAKGVFVKGHLIDKETGEVFAHFTRSNDGMLDSWTAYQIR